MLRRAQTTDILIILIINYTDNNKIHAIVVGCYNYLF